MLEISDTVRSTSTRDGQVLLDLRQGQMFSVNGVGAKILEFLAKGWDEAPIAEEISQAYAVSIDVVRSDVHEFVETLRKHEILRVNDSVDSR